MTGTVAGALIGAGGVLLGGALNRFWDWLLEKRRWEREQRLRLFDIRRDLYARFFALALKAARPQADDAEDRLWELWELEENLGIVGGERVQELAINLADSIARWFHLKGRPQEDAERGKTLLEIQRLRRAFCKAAKAELGVKEGRSGLLEGAQSET